MKRPTLLALARSRGLHVVCVDYGHYRACGDLLSEWSTCQIDIEAESDKVAREGLRAALEAMPARKDGKR